MFNLFSKPVTYLSISFCPNIKHYFLSINKALHFHCPERVCFAGVHNNSGT